ncbi:homeobox and leucine zipper protein Homez [Mixophyes fleayi]|uniref:homeobox and leucine zipper protein Homez n=1 Tax=Mixophyes fleayi TaxID=3061075 RepID=UPI003F4D8B3D
MSPTTTKAAGVYPEVTPGLVCLPPISDDLQLIWTQAELTHELDDHPQLIHTFSYFPYPSMPEIALLCLRYGLQMEKVKTWFMVQRIRCGISWSSEEIEETRSRLLYNQDQLHFKPLVALAKKSNMFKNLEKLPIPAPKSGAGPEILPHSPCSPSGDAAPETKKLRLNCMESDREQQTATNLPNEHRIQSPSWDIPGTYRHCATASNLNSEPEQIFWNSVKHPVTSQMLGADRTEITSAVSCLSSEEELYRSGWPTSRNMDDCKGLQADGILRREDYMPVMRRQRKTKEQLTILKSFFLHCQWARREDYKMLEEISGLPRSEIIQWFGDTRYALKHGQLKWFRDSAQERPSWLDEPQHLINQNGRHGEPTSGEYTGVQTLSPELRAPESESRTTIQALTTSVTHALTSSVVQRPVIKLTASFSQCSEKSMEKVPEIHNNYETASGTSKSTCNISNAKPLVINCTKPESLPQNHIQCTTFQKNYDVLEKYWCTNYRLQEVDLESLVTESGLSRQQVQDWFCSKSNKPAEVEVCLDEEEEDDDDVVIIQD